MLYFAHIPNFRKLGQAFSKVSAPLVFFIDFNNNLTNLYDERRLLSVISAYESHGIRVLLTPLLEQVLFLLKNFPKSKVVIHIESGRSLYHQKILATYKEARSYTWTMLSPKQIATFKDLLRLLKEIVTELFHALPDTHVIHLEFLEADFVPFYVVSRQLLEPSYQAVSFSSDKDLFQQLQLTNFLVQVRQIPSIKDERRAFVTKKTALYAFTGKEEFLTLSFIPEDRRQEVRQVLLSWLPVALAVAGDSDEFKGVPRLGYITFYKGLLNYLAELTNDWEDLSKLIEADLSRCIHNCDERREKIRRNLLAMVEVNKRQKVWQQVPLFEEVIFRNLKVADFAELSCYVDRENVVRNYFEQRLKDENYLDIDTFATVLKELTNCSENELDKLKRTYDEVLQKRNMDSRTEFSEDGLF